VKQTINTLFNVTTTVEICKFKNSLVSYSFRNRYDLILTGRKKHLDTPPEANGKSIILFIQRNALVQ